MCLATQPNASSSCTCPAAAGSTACPILRHTRLRQPTSTSWQRTTPSAAQPLSGWLQRRPLRALGNQGSPATQYFGPPSASTSFPTQGRSRQAPCCPALQDSGPAASAGAASVRTRRWGLAPATTARRRCPAVDSAAAGTGLSGAGPPGHGQAESATSSAAAASLPPSSSQDGTQPAASNGHPTASPQPTGAALDAASASQPSGSEPQQPSSPVPAAAATMAPAGAFDNSTDPRATSVDGLDDTRKFVFAEEWGYTRVGGDLPAGTTPATFSDMVPERFFAFDGWRAALSVLVPLSAMAAGYGWLWYMHSICPAWQACACAALIGTAYTGLFKVAHECARFAFLPQSPRLQDALGLLLMLPSLYPFTSWRIQYMHHLVHLNMLWEDTFGWHPYTKVQLATEVILEDRVALGLRRLVLTTPLKLFASVGHWLRSFDGLDLRRFDPETYGAVLAGWAAPILFLGIGVPAIIGAWGVSGLLTGYVLPWLVFHFWLSTLSLLQHTGPHIPFRAEGEGYDYGRAVVCGTVTVRLPRALEVLLNDANYTLPQLVAPGLPVFRVREAYEYMRERLLPYLTEATLSVRLLTNHITRWQVYDEEQQTYVPMEEVLHRVESDIDTVMAEAAKAEAAKAEGSPALGGDEGSASSPAFA